MFAAVVTLAHGQSAWDGATKPRMESENGNLYVHSHSDVSFMLRGSGQTGSISGVLDHIRNQASSACAAGEAVTGFDADGAPTCQSAVPDEIRNGLPTICQLSQWGEWGECNAGCDGAQVRSRNITREATNSVPCSEYRLEESRPCGPKCAGYTGCGDNEKWYYMNSGKDAAYIFSYVTQKVIFRRPQHSGSGAQRFDTSTSGGGGSGRALMINAGQGKLINPLWYGLADSSGFQAGDYFCGTVGNIEVSGQQGTTGAVPQREWVPDRLAGTEFVVQVPRSAPEVIQILALGQASVSVYKHADAAPYAMSWDMGLELGPGDVGRLVGVNNVNKIFKFNSTGPILVAYVARASSSYIATQFVGVQDYMPIVPAGPVVYGIPSQGSVAAWTDRGTTRFNYKCGRSGAAGNTVKTLGNPGRRVGLGSSGGHYTGYACRITTADSRPIAGMSTGDGDGGDGTSWMTPNLFRTKFILPVASQHIALVCLNGGPLRIKTSLSAAGAGRLANAACTNQICKYYSAPGAGYAAGTFVNTGSNPCMMIIDGKKMGQEMTVFGSN